MKTVRFTKQGKWGDRYTDPVILCKVGDIKEFTEKTAIMIVDSGYGVFVEEEEVANPVPEFLKKNNGGEASDDSEGSQASQVGTSDGDDAA